ncbi:beta-lactamase/transpeptidase-like protein [Trametes elegans]|nr:beta-lactamase/transpeptidase-like protein [Trametes elegans]
MYLSSSAVNGALLSILASLNWGASVARASDVQVPLYSAQVPTYQAKSLGSTILSSAFVNYVDEIGKNNSIPGISLSAVRLDQDHKPLVQHISLGRKTEDGGGYDLTPDTLFGLASCSKAFLATSFGLLIDDFAHGRNTTPLPPGVTRLDWDTKILALLPDEWLLDDEWTTLKASVRDVLGHVSGLPRYDFSYKPWDTTSDLLARMQNLRIAYELREKWSYNNQMYVLGAHLIAKYSNTTYQDFVREHLFTPLNMSTTTYWPSEALASGKLSDAWTKNGRRIPFWFTDDIARMNSGPGGVISSAEDMVKWVATWLNGGTNPITGRQVIPQNVYSAVTTAQHVVFGAPTPEYGVGVVGYGMGWQRWTYKGIEVVEHGGAIPGFSTATLFSPSSNFGLVVLANADGKAGVIDQILTRALDDALTLPSAVPADERSTKTRTSDPVDHVPFTPTSVPSLDIEAYAGTYTSLGHGTLTLCSAKSTSHYCAGVLADFASTSSDADSGGLDSDGPHLYGAFRSLWTTHIRLRHLSGDAFRAEYTALFPHGYGRNASAFKFVDVGSPRSGATFEVAAVDGPEAGSKVAGFALVIDEDAVAARRRRAPEGTPLKDVADDWFAKL